MWSNPEPRLEIFNRSGVPDMSSNEQNQVMEMDGEERYDYFLSQVAEDREIWILVNNDSRFLKIASDDGDVEYLPVWPTAAFASEYAKRRRRADASKHFIARFLPEVGSRLNKGWP